MPVAPTSSVPLSPSAPAAPSWPDIAAPIAPRQDRQITQLGRVRNDPYAWLEYIPPTGTRTLAGLPSPLREHLLGEMQYAQEMLQPLAADAALIARAMAERRATSAPPLPEASGVWRYDLQRAASGRHRVARRIGADGVVQPLVDEASRVDGHAYYRATDHQASLDDRYFAWAEDVIGDDRHRICILDIASGAIRTIVPADAFGYGGFTFSPSSRHLFWIWRDAHSRPTRLYRSAVDGSETVLVYGEHDPALFMRVARTAADGFVALTLFGPDTSEVRLIGADAETGEPRIVRPRQRGIRYEVDEWNGALLLLTNADGAFDRKLQRLDPGSLDVERELIAHRPGVPIILVRPFAAALVHLERVAGLHRLVLTYPDGKQTPIAFPDPAYTIDLVPAQPYRSDKIRIIHQTPASPPRWLDVSLSTGSLQAIAQERLATFDPDRYRVERLQATAADGALIPITVLSRRDAPSDGSTPLLLTGYGAYGIASEARFSLAATILVDAGFRHAIAHVRGGSELGWRWYQDGCRENKRNSMTDFIACAEHLQAHGLAAPGQIVAHGLSAGGLLVCGAMNIAPQLWAGVIAQVPFVDMLNTMSNADHPLVPLLRPDWGDPLADPAAYDAMAAISPYENVQPAAYPPLLCTAGLKDDRVPYWEPAKLLAHLRHRSTGRQPAIMVLDPDSGHQQSDDQAGAFAEAALLWAFARHCVTRTADPLA